MCTAMTYKTRDHYFGRNLDLEYTYNETVTVMPRNFPLEFRRCGRLSHHYAVIGMATVADGYPLYYDATNEKGLSVAGLNFPGNADYKSEMVGKDNVSPFEFIPWILGQCENLSETRNMLEKINLVKIDFSDELPLSPLHWMISDRESSIVVECVKDGLKIYDNPVQVLTNNPTFDMQLFNLNNYMHLSTEQPANSFSTELNLSAYSRGMGALGLPGDLSSMSRFVRAAFVRMKARSGDSESGSVSQFFHMLDFVAHPRGLVHMGGGKYEITQYSSCCNTDRGIYYYTTYENRRIAGVDMRLENLDGSALVCYPLEVVQQIHIQNEKG